MSERDGNGAAAPPPAGNGAANGAANGAGGADDLRSLIAGAVADEKKLAGAADEPPASAGAGPAPHPEPPAEGDPRLREGAAPELPLDDRPQEKPEPEKPEPEKPAEKPAPAGAAAPEHWSAADKATFMALPEAARTPFLDLYKRMEQGFTPKLQRGAQLERDYGELDRQIFTPDQRRIIEARGETPLSLINAWANVERALGGADGAVKAQLVGRIIHNYRVDPGEVAKVINELRGFAGQGGGDQPAPAAPAAGAIDPALKARLDALEADVQARRQSEEAAAYRAAGDEIRAFAEAKDEAGQPAHPFFPELEAEMTSLAQADRLMGKAPVLTDLYQRALWANPATRNKELARQREVEAKRAAEERKIKAEQARRAASSVTGGPGSPGAGQASASGGDLSLRDQIKANMAGAARTSGGPGRI